MNDRDPQLRLLPPQRLAGGNQIAPLQYTIPDTGRLLAASQRTVERLIARGELATVERGRPKRVPYDSIVAYQNRHRGGHLMGRKSQQGLPPGIQRDQHDVFWVTLEGDEAWLWRATRALAAVPQSRDVEGGRQAPAPADRRPQGQPRGKVTGRRGVRLTKPNASVDWRHAQHHPPTDASGVGSMPELQLWRKRTH